MDGKKVLFPLVTLISLSCQDQTNITAEPGQNVTLPCRADQNRPVIVAEWIRTDIKAEYVLRYRDEQSDPEHQHRSFKNRVRLQDGQMKAGNVALVLRKVTSDDRGTYQCWVVEEHSSEKKLIGTIHLDVAPPVPTQDQTNITAEPGQNVTLPCRADQNRPVIVAEWIRTDIKAEYVLRYRDEQSDPEHQHRSFKNRVHLQDRQMKAGNVALVLRKVKSDDRGTYQCWVVEERRSEKKLIGTINLDVAPPVPTQGNKDGSRKYGTGHQHHGLIGAAVFITGTICSCLVLLCKEQG
ncbi:programmed cell death 1 ligand 1 [Fundulus heteroclitus]|uniref:programmed cell death 1 ligand 1 n=1 Tax=Fundulus heteroclitus TaxID=8078 RepID=UPI00165BA461|nr:programmed cell death 1 ligand 1 [Fundulus heteroclitus]